MLLGFSSSAEGFKPIRQVCFHMALPPRAALSIMNCPQNRDPSCSGFEAGAEGKTRDRNNSRKHLEEEMGLESVHTQHQSKCDPVRPKYVETSKTRKRFLAAHLLMLEQKVCLYVCAVSRTSPVQATSLADPDRLLIRSSLVSLVLWEQIPGAERKLHNIVELWEPGRDLSK